MIGRPAASAFAAVSGGDAESAGAVEHDVERVGATRDQHRSHRDESSSSIEFARS